MNILNFNLSLFKEFWRRKSFFFSILRILIVLFFVNFLAIIFGVVSVFVPLSVRCAPQEISHGGLTNLGTLPLDLPQGVPPPVQTSQDMYGEKKCYSIFHKAYWVNPTWKLEYPKFFSQNENAATVVFADKVQKTLIAHPLYAANYADDSILMGASHNVFVGKVIAQVGNNELAGSPTTQFSVEVISNTKGNLKDMIVVNQLAGYRDGALYLMDEESKLLEIGSTYLFATRYNAEDDTHTLNSHPNASKLLSSNSAFDKKDLKALVDKDEKVKSLEAAYATEVLLDADIAHNNTRNSFQSLPPEAKAAAQARAGAARAALGASAQAE